MKLEDSQDVVVQHLQKLNESLTKQNSVRHIFLTGVIYGIGWVIGSGIIATIILGIVGPFLGQIPWIHDTFKAGVEIVR